MTLVNEIMNKCHVVIAPETTLAETVKIFSEKHVGGAPVVDADGAIVGMISELQLLDVVFDAAARTAPVSDYMTLDVQTVQPTDPLPCVAQLFALYSIRRLPVVENGTLLGIVTGRDLMNHALRTEEVLTEPLFELIPELGQLT